LVGTEQADQGSVAALPSSGRAVGAFGMPSVLPRGMCSSELRDTDAVVGGV
jgi:hypothetical protein